MSKLTRFLSKGCHVTAADRSSKIPCSFIRIFPTTISSAGQPYTRIVPLIPSCSIRSLRLHAAPAHALPSRLCPQPCPGPPFPFCRGTHPCASPGSASYSARNPITGVPQPHSAIKAVSNPASPQLTANPSPYLPEHLPMWFFVVFLFVFCGFLPYCLILILLFSCGYSIITCRNVCSYIYRSRRPKTYQYIVFRRESKTL